MIGIGPRCVAAVASALGLLAWATMAGSALAEFMPANALGAPSAPGYARETCPPTFEPVGVAFPQLDSRYADLYTARPVLGDYRFVVSAGPAGDRVLALDFQGETVWQLPVPAGRTVALEALGGEYPKAAVLISGGGLPPALDLVSEQSLRLTSVPLGAPASARQMKVGPAGTGIVVAWVTSARGAQRATVLVVSALGRVVGRLSFAAPRGARASVRLAAVAAGTDVLWQTSRRLAVYVASAPRPPAGPYRLLPGESPGEAVALPGGLLYLAAPPSAAGPADAEMWRLSPSPVRLWRRGGTDLAAGAVWNGRDLVVGGGAGQVLTLNATTGAIVSRLGVGVGAHPIVAGAFGTMVLVWSPRAKGPSAVTVPRLVAYDRRGRRLWSTDLAPEGVYAPPSATPPPASLYGFMDYGVVLDAAFGPSLLAWNPPLSCPLGGGR